jgi:hypothetical protein
LGEAFFLGKLLRRFACRKRPEASNVLEVVNLLEENVMKRVMIAAVAAATLATPAFADFYIVREGTAGQCRIVETRPTDTKIVVIGNQVYKTRADAEKQLTVVCKAK